MQKVTLRIWEFYLLFDRNLTTFLTITIILQSPAGVVTMAKYIMSTGDQPTMEIFAIGFLTIVCVVPITFNTFITSEWISTQVYLI